MGFQVETSQNVLLSYPPAGLGKRISANLLDFLFKMAYVILIRFVITPFLFEDVYGQERIWLSVVIYLPLMFYNLVTETFLDGQTPGKKILKIKVIKEDGSQASFGNYAIRWTFRLLDFLFTFNVLAVSMVAATKKQQRLGDLLAKTIVVSTDQKISLSKSDFVKTEENYSIVYPEIAQFTQEDYDFIKKVLDFFTETGNIEHVNVLGKKLKAKYQIQSTEPPLKFLKTLLKDYTHQNVEVY